MDQKTIVATTWWIQPAMLPSVSWARLREYADGTCDVLSFISSFGGIDQYSTDLAALSILAAEGFVELERFKQSGELPTDPTVSLIPPSAENDEELAKVLMVLPASTSDVFQHLREMLSCVPERDWTGLESKYRALCEKSAGSLSTERIANVDMADYECRMSEQFIKGIQRAVLLKAPALYAEYDPDNGWSSFFSVNKERDDGSSLNWLRNTHEHWKGPDFPVFADLWPSSLGDSPSGMGQTVYLAARTLAAIGRALEPIDSHGITIYFARHDDYDSIVPMVPGGTPDFTSIPDVERNETLEREADVRAQKALMRLSSFVATDAERNAIAALARAGAGIGKYPASPSGIDYVYLEGTDATDSDLYPLEHLVSIQNLTLDHTKITDDGLVHLTQLHQLSGLALDHTSVTDRGLTHLSRLINLKYVTLRGTKVTAEGAASLRQMLPNTEVST